MAARGTRVVLALTLALAACACAAAKRGDVRYVEVSPKICDPDVVQYAGYVTIDEESQVEYFFWFFGSRSATACVSAGASGVTAV